MPKRHRVQASSRSVVARVEEVVLASSGADAFELVFSIVAARLAGAANGRRELLRALDRAARRWPGLEAARALEVGDDVLAEVEALLDRMHLGGAIDGDSPADARGDAEALDAVFEQLVTRVGKGQKGQFFTPRHVVDAATRSLLLARGERVVDPACGSGAFLVHARAAAAVDAWGFDVDARAVRVARLLAVATGGDPSAIVRGDSLAAGAPLPADVDVVVTNPPFAGDARYPGYALAANGRRAERDALFLERCVELLRPGGRLAIVLPHNKVAAASFRDLRRWLIERARVLAVVSLPRETFLPHTAQKAVLLFARKRRPRERRRDDERVFFAVSERAGKDAAGEPVLRAGAAASGVVTWRALDHDLDAVVAPLADFLHAEGFAT